jgi:hypothetical protein
LHYQTARPSGVNLSQSWQIDAHAIEYERPSAQPIRPGGATLTHALWENTADVIATTHGG